ncbi:MAG: hypothetical protein J0L62_08110 [Bacteroidetes bacterium]|nr:hypothetical protein [Bacteroidota bacterium]
MKKYALIAFYLVVFAVGGFAQVNLMYESHSGKNVLIFESGENQADVFNSENYFFDDEYQVPAFGFFLSHDPGSIRQSATKEGWFKTSYSPGLKSDQVLDGTEKKMVHDLSEVPFTNAAFPVWSVKQLNFRGNVYYHFIVRPWIQTQKTLTLISNIQFETGGSSSNPPVVLSGLSIFETKQKPSPVLQKSISSTPSFDKNKGIVFRLLISKTGIAKVFYSDLNVPGNVLNFNNTDSRRIKVYNNGEEIPILISDGGDGLFSDGDFIEFFCDELIINRSNPMKDSYFDPFSNKNVYFLVLNSDEISGNRLGVISGELKEPISLGDPRNLIGESFLSKVHFEQNKVFEPLSKKDTTKTVDFRDHWFWNQIALNEQTSYPTPIPFPDGLSFSDVKITLGLHGITYTKRSGFTNEHNLKVDIGTRQKALSLGFPISGTDKWNGQELNIVEYKVPPSTFIAYMGGSDASIFIQNYDPFSPNVAASRQFALNWIEIEYYRLYTAKNNYLDFRIPDGKTADLYQFVIQEFTGSKIEIYKKGVGKISNFSIESYPGQEANSSRFYRAIFQDYVVNPVSTEYIALSDDAKIKPEAIQYVTPSVLLTPENPTLKNSDRDESMIIISADKFWSKEISQSSFSPVKQYSEYRELILNARSVNDEKLSGRSRQVLTTSVSDIYDEFSNGIKSPYAIRDFIRYAVRSWKRPPIHILLIGDASTSYYSADDLIPSMQVQTVEYGSAASDPWYAMIDGDDIIPDIALGRIPAKTSDEIFAYLNKLKAYEADKNFNGWRNNSLFISGFEESFISDNDTLRNLSSKNYFTDVLHIKELVPGNDPFFGGKSQLINYLNKGQVVVNFMGHGGGGIWADRGLFDIPDVDRLAQSSKLSFVTSLTCYTGAFSEPGRVSLMEKMILTASKGSIGGLGSSGVGWKKNNRYLGESIFRYLLNPKYRNLTSGQLIDLAKFFYRIRYSDYVTYPFLIPNSQIHQYNFLGDPSVILNLPDEDISATLSSQLLGSTDSVKLAFQTEKIQNGTINVKFADRLNQDLFASSSGSFNLSNGSFSGSIPVPSGLKGKEGYLKYYVSDTESDGAGSIKFSYSNVLLNYVTSTDSLQSENNPLSLAVSLQSKVQLINGKITITIVDQVQDIGTLGKKANIGLVNSTAGNEGIIYSNEFDLTKNFNGLWVMTDTIPRNFVKNGYLYKYQVKVTDNSSQDYQFSGYYELKELPDVSAAPQIAGIGSEYYTNTSIGFYYDNGPKIGARVYNNSNLDIDKVRVRFFGGGVVSSDPPFFSGNVLRLGETTISLSRNSDKMVFIPIPPDTVMTPGSVYQLSVQVLADSSEGQREKSYTNNLSKPITIPFDLYEVGKNKRDIVKLPGLSLDFSKLSSESLALYIKKNGSTKINNQPKLNSVNIPELGESAFDLISFDPSVKENFPADVEVTFKYGPESGVASAISLFEFEIKSNKWLSIPTIEDTITKSITSTLKRFGTYRLFRMDDIDPPLVSVSVNGNNLVNNGIVPLKGNYTLVVQDDNGVSRRKESIFISVDGVPISSSDLAIPDTLADGNQMVLNFKQSLSPGNHFLSFSFQDANGNEVKTENLEFTASNKSDFIFYGGFPNPFQGYQIFTFLLNSVATRVQLKIYTVSGQQINKFDTKSATNPLSFFPDQNYTGLGIINVQSSESIFGYQEIFWNGTDLDGYPVATGVYFVKVIISFEDGKSSEKVFKSVRYN